jgi:hypothetical protein
MSLFYWDVFHYPKNVFMFILVISLMAKSLM